MSFTKFTATSQRNEDRITVTKSRSFGFPTKFFNDNHIEDYKFVVLFYDKERNAVGFQFINDENEPHKFSIIKSNKGFGGSVVATSFFKTNNIAPETYRGRYAWKIEEIEGFGKVFVIDLKSREQENPASVPQV